MHELARSLAHKWRRKRCAAPIRHLRDAIELAHPYGAHEWRWCGAGLARALVFLLLALPATAAPPPGTDLNSPTHQWFEAQHSVAGAWCCDVSDGHLLDDTDWRQGSDHYEVRISGSWYPIPDTAMRDPRGGPNPTGKAIVWYIAGEAGVRIYCFCPGFEG